MRIAHIITRMIVGGAQENTLLNCKDLLHIYGDDVLLITGPALGPEGNGDAIPRWCYRRTGGRPNPKGPRPIAG